MKTYSLILALLFSVPTVLYSMAPEEEKQTEKAERGGCAGGGGQQDEDTAEGVCIICFKPINKGNQASLDQFECSHIGNLHKQCLQEALKEDKRCPICRMFDKAPQKYSSIFVAIRKDSLAGVRDLLKRNQKMVNNVDKEGDTPLIKAIKGPQNNEMLKLLLDNGAQINRINSRSNTPLLCLLANQSVRQDSVQLLLDRGASVDTVDDNGTTPLMQAARYGAPEIVELLLARGAQVNQQDNDGKTALMYVVNSIYEFLRNNRAEQKCLILLKHGALSNIRDNKGNTALKLAAEKSQMECVAALLKQSSDIEVSDNEGLTPLMVAVRRNCVPTVDLLLDAGAKINACDSLGETALMKALQIRSYYYPGNDLLINLLIARKSSLDIKNNSGKTVLDLALERRQNYLVQIIINAQLQREAEQKKQEDETGAVDKRKRDEQHEDDADKGGAPAEELKRVRSNE